MKRRSLRDREDKSKKSRSTNEIVYGRLARSSSWFIHGKNWGPERRKTFLKLFTNSVEELQPEFMLLHSQSISPFLPLILISTNLGVLQQRTVAAPVKLKLEMETNIMNRKRILPSLFLIIFCPAILRFILEGMASGDQGTAGSQVIRHGFISLSGFPSLTFCCCLFVCFC